MIKPTKLNLKDLNLEYSQNQKITDFILSDSGSGVPYQTTKDIDAVAFIREGIPKRAVNNIIEKTRVSKQQLSQIMHISSRQLDRYTDKDNLPVEQSNFLYEFSRIYTRAMDILGDVFTVDNWLTRLNVALGEKTPIQLMDTSEGLRMVDNLLSQIEYGFHS